MKNWKTTAVGIGMILVAIGSTLTALFDSDPTTNLDLKATAIAITAGVGFIMAKDAAGSDAPKP